MKKIGKLNGKVVVAGDKNLVTANQIHYEEKDGNITISERKGGSLEVISGGNSNNNSVENEVLYYKVIENNDEIIVDGISTGMTYSDYIVNMYQGTLEYAAKYISIKAVYEDKYMEINEAADISGSQQYRSGSLIKVLRECVQDKTLKGFSIYSEKFTFLDLSDNTVKETPKGDFYIKAATYILTIVPGDIEYLVELLKKVIISISKEEYEALS